MILVIRSIAFCVNEIKLDVTEKKPIDLISLIWSRLRYYINIVCKRLASFKP